jgi:hypothetical protein
VPPQKHRTVHDVAASDIGIEGIPLLVLAPNSYPDLDLSYLFWRSMGEGRMDLETMACGTGISEVECPGYDQRT